MLSPRGELGETIVGAFPESGLLFDAPGAIDTTDNRFPFVDDAGRAYLAVTGDKPYGSVEEHDEQFTAYILAPIKRPAPDVTVYAMESHTSSLGNVLGGAAVSDAALARTARLYNKLGTMVRSLNRAVYIPPFSLPDIAVIDDENHPRALLLPPFAFEPKGEKKPPTIPERLNSMREELAAHPSDISPEGRELLVAHLRAGLRQYKTVV